MLSAYRNAIQSIYDWSPEFRDKYFPTLLQSAGQQGGTEMMTALSNYVGQHMQHSEIKALQAAGFVNNKDIVYNKVGDIKGFKPGAQLFEQDVFKKNIMQWSWDFHDAFMKRKGATEDSFGDLIAKMPRNMASLIAFNVHNRARLQRDAESTLLPAGMKAQDDYYLGQNPTAGIEAIKDSITQFSAAMMAPAVAASGPVLEAIAHGAQQIAAVTGQFAKDHPDAVTTAGASAAVAGTAGGGYLLLKMLSGFGKFFGFGGGAAGAAGAAGTAGAAGAAAAEGGAAAGGASLLGRLLAVLTSGPTAALTAPLALCLTKVNAFTGLPSDRLFAFRGDFPAERVVDELGRLELLEPNAYACLSYVSRL